MSYIKIIKIRGNGLTYGPIKLTHMQDFFSYYMRQQTILAGVTVGCQSNGCRVSSISDLLAPARTGPPAPASRIGLTAPYYSHCWPGHSSTHPHLLLFFGDGSRTSKPSYSRTPLRVGNNCRVFPASVSFPS